MCRRHTATVLVLVCIGLAGCYRTYSGNYLLKPASMGAPFDPATLPTTVWDAIEPFGFKWEYQDQTVILYTRDIRAMQPDVATLAGANARVLVAITFGRQPSITIRDLDNVKETDFVAALKRSLKKQLREQYGIRGLKFERTLDWLA